jgi:hypothetical protein
MEFIETDETRYYVTDAVEALPSGTYPILAREDGTKWFRDSNAQVFQIPGRFGGVEMEHFKKSLWYTKAELKRAYETQWDRGGQYTIEPARKIIKSP